MQAQAKRIALAVLTSIMTLSVAGFVCGAIMGFLDTAGTDKPGSILRAGWAGINFGLLVFGLPIAGVSAFAALRWKP